MKVLKNMTIAITTALILSGCGDNSSVTDTNVNYDQQDLGAAIPVDVEYNDYSVKVVDDEITGANVRASECNSSEESATEKGVYILKNCVAKPSYIVVEGGKIGDTNVRQNFPLLLNTANINSEDGFVVTPLTTLVADANETDIKAIAEKFGLSKDELFKDPAKLEKNITNTLQKINAIYLKADSDGAVADKMKFIQVVRKNIKTIEVTDTGDFNVTDVADKIETESQGNPAMFGLVFIGDLKNSSDILTEIKETQNPTKVTFLGLVFDDPVGGANVSVYRTDTNDSLIENPDDLKTDEKTGRWVVEFNQSIVDTINKKDFIVVFKAKKDKIVLQSSMSSKQLRDLLKNHKKLTPSKSADLIISNVTTVENAILQKRGALKDSKNFENNKTDLKTYYSDKILTASAAVKNMVDGNGSLGDDYDDTYQFVFENVTPDKVELNKSIEGNGTTKLKNDIKENSLLSQQLQFNQNSSDLGGKTENNGFEDVSNTNGNTFYRILAYYKKDGAFIREYTKIITLPGKYETKSCYLEGNVTTDWKCDKPITLSVANFSDGIYNARDDEMNLTTYSLDKVDDIYVSALNKSYSLYSVSKNNYSSNQLKNSEQEVLVGDFDIVDMFRRMPKEDKKSFDDLQDEVKGKARDEVNVELNRYIKEQMSEIKKYFKEQK